jgi:quercetin dioxygenase-like cupin family protein
MDPFATLFRDYLNEECLNRGMALAAANCYLAGMNEQPLIDAGREKILSLAAETQYAPNGVVSRTLLRTENMRMVLFGFAPGQELTEHTSTQHALIQILSGACEFSLAGKPRELKAGDLLYMPPNVPHAVKATEQFSMLLTLFKPATAPDANDTPTSSTAG